MKIKSAYETADDVATFGMPPSVEPEVDSTFSVEDAGLEYSHGYTDADGGDSLTAAVPDAAGNAND